MTEFVEVPNRNLFDFKFLPMSFTNSFLRNLANISTHRVRAMNLALACCLIVSVAASLVSPDAFAQKAKMQRYTKALKNHPPVSSVAVLPTNYNEYIKPAEKAIIDAAFKEALSELPFTFTYVELKDAKLRDFYVQITQELGGEDPEEFVPFQKQLIETINSSADLVLTVSVEQRLATLKGATARWDGISFGISYDGGRPSENFSWSGNQTGLSLRLDGYTKAGEKLFSSWGALMFPKTADSEQSRFVRRGNALESAKDKKNMRRGIKAVLKPFRKKVKAVKPS